MGYSITIAAGKGGTGKTTISANLGVALAQLGKDVTILDADIAMANLELILGMEGKDITLQKVLAGEAEVKEAIYEGPAGVKIVPAGINLSGLGRSDPEKLMMVLSELLENTEILIIDAPAGLGREVYIALTMGQNALLVVNPDISSLSDALKTAKIAKRVGTNVIGTVLNRVNYDTYDLITAEQVRSVLQVPILAVVPENIEVRRSSAMGIPLVIRLPDTQTATIIKKLAYELIGEKYIPPEGPKEEGVSVLKKMLYGLGIGLRLKR